MSEHTGRNLRPRKQGQSFAEMFQSPESDEDIGDESGPDGEDSGLRRKRLPPIEEPVSDSEYDPGEERAESEAPTSSSLSEGVPSENDGGDSDALIDDGSVVDVGPPSPSGVLSRTARYVKRSRPSKSAPKLSGQELVVASFNFTQRRPGNRTAAANPVIGLLRARAAHLYTFPGPSRRLSKKPLPFEEPQFVSTNGHASSVAARVTKAWSFSVFPGPVWELMEDMAYFKEVEQTVAGERRRPVVHSDVYVHSENFEIVDPSYATYPPNIQLDFA
jgi:transcription factor C subunit 6